VSGERAETGSTRRRGGAERELGEKSGEQSRRRRTGEESCEKDPTPRRRIRSLERNLSGQKLHKKGPPRRRTSNPVPRCPQWRRPPSSCLKHRRKMSSAASSVQTESGSLSRMT
jgi:hypothetical protein